jgi:hypothetical protein
MFIQITDDKNLIIEKKVGNLLNKISVPLIDIVDKRFCIVGTEFGKIFERNEHVKTMIYEKELESIYRDGSIPIYIWFFPFFGKGWMAVNFFKDGKDKSVAIPVNFVSSGVEI